MKLTLDTAPAGASAFLAAVAWVYLVTNGVRLFTYLPQIVAVWKCRDGAHAISLLTWGSWTVSHVTGVLVIHDTFFTVISTVNLLGCGIVTVLAAQRRAGWALLNESPGSDALTPAARARASGP